MDMFVVKGGRRLHGRVRVGGSKNAALPIMAATIAADGPTLLDNVPELVDVATLASLLRKLGLSVERQGTQARIEVLDSASAVADYDLVRQMRASVCVLGPLLARRGYACVSLPGGCNIGDRPIDLHLKGLRALGAEIHVRRGYVVAEADRLRGADVFLGGAFGSTVTGTCNVMVAASLAEGRTTIEAAACEPEVVDLGNFLIAMGARIQGLGTPLLTIDGVERLSGTRYSIISDRIEAATLMIAAAITGGDIELDGVRTDHLTAVVEKLKELGVQIEHRGSGALRVSRLGPLGSADCTALPYPGLPTDVQAQCMALLAASGRLSVVTDKVFPDRFMHVAELNRMGACIRREGGTAIIHGVGSLSGACVMASDLRASAALVLAALAADGHSVIRRIYHLDRGYHDLDRKLNALGADVRRLADEPANMPLSLNLPDELDTHPVVRGPKWLSRPPAIRPVASDTDE
ncbi:MAG: UDP-N-acetylglucosamine 1-carboxyvinyltransferase [Planctomycetaceae bacterium]